jgi:hypothetical protein
MAFNSIIADEELAMPESGKMPESDKLSKGKTSGQSDARLRETPSFKVAAEFFGPTRKDLNSILAGHCTMTTMNKLCTCRQIWGRIAEKIGMEGVAFAEFGPEYLYGNLSSSVHHPHVPYLAVLDSTSAPLRAFIHAIAAKYNVDVHDVRLADALVGEKLLADPALARKEFGLHTGSKELHMLT